VRVFNTRTGGLKFEIEARKSSEARTRPCFFSEVLDDDRVLLCSKERFMCISDFAGRIVKSFGLEDKALEFNCAVMSNRMKYVYGMCSNNYVYCFS